MSENIFHITPFNLPTRLDPSSSATSTIDLTFASSIIGPFCNLFRLNSLWNSDHWPLIISLGIKVTPPIERTPKFHFDKSKWGVWNSLEDVIAEKGF